MRTGLRLRIRRPDLRLRSRPLLRSQAFAVRQAERHVRQEAQQLLRTGLRLRSLRRTSLRLRTGLRLRS